MQFIIKQKKMPCLNSDKPFNQAKRRLTAEQSYWLTSTLELLHPWLSRDFHVMDLHTPPKIGEGNPI